jgi:hypothetical protein
VLQKRKAVLMVLSLEKQVLDQAGGDADGRRGRLDNCSLALHVAHSGQQEQAAVHALRQFVEKRAVLQIFRPHGGHDIKSRFGVLGGLQEQFHEKGGVILRLRMRVPAAVAE